MTGGVAPPLRLTGREDWLVTTVEGLSHRADPMEQVLL